MNKQLILAEKPSVARNIAKVLHCTKKDEGYLEGKDKIVTWALGHLIELAGPETYNEKYKTWKMEDLPIIPDKMKLNVIKQSSKQYYTVKKLLNRKDINEIVIATDAGREGELVARWTLDHALCRKPIKRLWISSVTDKAIRDGFNNLRDGKEFETLYLSAVARAKSDWLVGLNATRALTCKYNAQLSCGRVQTPTLNLVAHRQEDIKNFVSKPYYQIKLIAGNVPFTWKNLKTKESRIFNRTLAQSKIKNIQYNNITIESVERKEKSIVSPHLYDLTSLQRDANKLYHFSPKETLSIAQRLYENYKVLTYPRTDSKYISSDMVDTLPQRLEAIKFGEYASFVTKVKTTNLKSQNHFVNNNKVTDHHAIIPTEESFPFGGLSEREEKIYDLVVKRFLAVLFPSYKYEVMTINAYCGKEHFIATVKSVLNEGWKVLYPSQEDNAKVLPSVKKSEILPITSVNLIEDKTKPPALFTEGTILEAMENPSKVFNLHSKVLKDVLGESGGLGTVATRADIIEKLYSKGLMEKKGEHLSVTNKGNQLLDLVPEELKSPKLTAQWELKLDDIRKGTLKNQDFLQDIKGYTIQILNEIKNSQAKFVHDNITGDKCPKCGGGMLKEKDKKGEILICSDNTCRHRERLSTKTNARCTNCHKRLSLYGKGEGQIFVCSCGFREKLSAFQQRKDKQKKGISKKEALKYMKKNAQDDSGNTALKDALSKLKFDE